MFILGMGAMWFFFFGGGREGALMMTSKTNVSFCLFVLGFGMSKANFYAQKKINKSYIFMEVLKLYTRTCFRIFINTVEPRYNEVLGTMKITLLYQVSHYIRVKKQRNIKSWDQQNYLVIRGFCYIRPLYNEVPLYTTVFRQFHMLGLTFHL